MVRAPPCHGGSCGFEPRLPRIFRIFLFVVEALIILSACSPQSLDDFSEEGDVINRQLVAELKQIHSRDDLLTHADKLQVLFNQLVDVIIQAESFKKTHPNATGNGTRDQTVADQLRIELNRVLHMEGGREVLEKSQEEALNRLDAFEQKHTH